MSLRVARSIQLLLLLLAAAVVSTHVPGVLHLDKFTFGKIIGGKRHVLVCVCDEAHEHSDAWKTFAQVVGQRGYSGNVLIADLFIGDYRKVLHTKSSAVGSIEHLSLPVYLLFPSGYTDASALITTANSVDDFASFVYLHTKEDFKFNGRMIEFDQLAKKYMRAYSQDRHKVVEEANMLLLEKEEENEFEDEIKCGRYYITTMRKHGEVGMDYAQKEKARLMKIRESSVAPAKAQWISLRMNILDAFLPDKQPVEFGPHRDPKDPFNDEDEDEDE